MDPLRATALLAGIAMLVAAGCGSDDPAPKRMRRGALKLKTCDAAEKVAFWYAQFTSGEQTEVAGKRLPTWQLIGEKALIAQGEAATDFLLSKDRDEEYRTSPNILSNVLRFVTELKGARGHARLHAFLLHWLEPDNCPPVSEGNDWVSYWRKPIFALFTHYPDPALAAACVEELDRKERVHDLREYAVLTLLRAGVYAPLKERYRALPPGLRHKLLALLYEAAEIDLPMAQAFRDEIEASCDAGESRERIYAVATRLRLGEDRMADRLMAEYERAKKLGAIDPAWVALRALAVNRRDPRVLRICLDEAGHGGETFAATVAGELLRKYWLDEPEVKALLWQLFADQDEARPLDPLIVRALLIVERARIVAFLKNCIRGENQVWRRSAIQFAAVKGAVPETGPEILSLLQKETDPDRRANLYGTLLALRAKAVLPVARAEFEDTDHGSLRSAIMLLLLSFDDQGGIAQVARRISAGHRETLDALFTLAVQRGGDALPAGVIPALVHAVEHAAGEAERSRALYVLRSRGSLAEAREGLSRAYRTEPSRRLAGQIETVLVELAHR